MVIRDAGGEGRDKFTICRIQRPLGVSTKHQPPETGAAAQEGPPWSWREQTNQGSVPPLLARPCVAFLLFCITCNGHFDFGGRESCSELVPHVHPTSRAKTLIPPASSPCGFKWWPSNVTDTTNYAGMQSTKAWCCSVAL